MNFYNDMEPTVYAWLRRLVATGHLPAGDVSPAPVQLLAAANLASYTSAHFFAGIGGWPLALRMAGWPDDKPVWTASLPCQPFSNAGKRLGDKDERHLWPVFRALVAECRPPVIFGEQVASRAGREWLAGVRADLEALGYAVGAADLCAAGVGAPHIRQRLFWVADADQPGRGPRGEAAEAARYGRSFGSEGWAGARWHLCLDGKYRRIPVEPELFPLAHGVPGRVGQLRAYGNAIVPQAAAEFVRAFTEARP